MRVSQTFTQLVSVFSRIGCFSVGGGAIPICWIPANKCSQLVVELEKLYGNVPSNFSTWLASRAGPLFVAWVTGFKPDGEDSRPDRGLLPLARMLFGYKVNILTIVSGPAKAAMWSSLRQSGLGRAPSFCSRYCRN